MSLSERLKIARESIGKSQKEMAQLCGASYRSWQGYEAGETPPKAENIESLVKLGFNANWLLTGEGEMRRDDAKHIDPAHNSGVTQEIIDFIAAIGSDKPVRVAEPGAGGFVPHLSAEVAELAVLLENYAGKALKADLKAKLIKIKDMVEG